MKTEQATSPDRRLQMHDDQCHATPWPESDCSLEMHSYLLLICFINNYWYLQHYATNASLLVLITRVQLQKKMSLNLGLKQNHITIYCQFRKMLQREWCTDCVEEKRVKTMLNIAKCLQWRRYVKRTSWNFDNTEKKLDTVTDLFRIAL